MEGMVTPDFTQAQDSITDGIYMVQIGEVEVKESKKSGDKYLNWTFETINEEEPKNNGRKLWHITMIEGKGARMLQDFARACGEEIDGEFAPSDFIGKQLEVAVALDNENRPKVKSVKAVG